MKQIQKKIMALALKDYTDKQVCEMCKSEEAEDIRVEYSGERHASTPYRNELVIELLTTAWDEERNKFNRMKEITACCPACHKKHSKGEDVDIHNGYYVSYYGRKNRY